MERNLVYRSGVLIASILLAVLTLPPLVECGGTDGNAGMKGYDTPQALTATYRHALATKDWQSCFLCYDPKMRGDFLIRLCYAAAVTRDAELTAIIKRHWIHENITPDPRRNDRACKELRAYEKIQKEVDDLPRFVDEMCRRLDAMGQKSCSELGDVRDISTQGDKAIGYWNRPAESIGPVGGSNATSHKADARGKSVPTAPNRSNVADVPDKLGQPLPGDRVPVHFRKLDDKWYMTIPDPPRPCRSVSAQTLEGGSRVAICLPVL